MTTMKRRTAAIARLCALGLTLSSVACAASSGPAMDARTQQAVIASAIAQLDRAYVFPETAKTMGADLRARLQRKEFEGLDGDGLAEAMTKALRSVSHDGHLEVRYIVDAPSPGAAPNPASKAGDGELVQQRRLNFGMAHVERLKGNLGYIDVHQFGRPNGAAPRISAAMGFLADTDALIIDLRKCGGGDPETVMAFASYLYDRPTHLNDVYWRDENRLETRWTQATVPGKRYGASRPVFLLTSRDTFSGCEDLAYAMKNNRRAVVVGETTGGGAHAGGPQPLADHFMMFVPTGRPINPVTHGDWEGVGVAPDVAVSADSALDVAQMAALKTLAAKETDAEWKVKLEERISELK
ncbi:peptidase [Lysobacter sp. TY2-98]|uniref:S41 family peptidase n=1 Tax=Lysobacter sp. TY2-98 TaxID=2290922 RepID=UPI000E209FFC|nr:S41 family peptidase [Lysobacter sp. TY2-98]AXK72164.1 peptidase [Lysobacter sp. TY2-98]